MHYRRPWSWFRTSTDTPPQPNPKVAPAPVLPPAATASGTRRWRVLVIDDHVPIQEWIRETLTPHQIDVTAVRSGEEALDLIESGERFDAAICDVMIPHAEIEGIAAARILWHEHNIPCLMLTSVQEAGARFAALYAGAMGYVLKDMAAASLLRDHVQAVLEGRPVPDPTLSFHLTEREVQQIAEIQASYQRMIELLTPQQRVIAQMIMAGKTNREISEELHLSRSTVNTHVSNILQRLNLATRRAVGRVLMHHQGHPPLQR